MIKNALITTISLVLLAGLVLFLLNFSQSQGLNGLRDNCKYKLNIIRQNTLNFISPKRRPPFTIIALKENLKTALPVPFVEFTEEEWERFWNWIYGNFEEAKDDWPKRKRQLTKEEIQDMLRSYYRNPFGYFREQQWDIFWKQVLKGKVFK